MHHSADERPRVRPGYIRSNGKLSQPGPSDHDVAKQVNCIACDSTAERIGPDRLLYLKRVAEHERVIEICTGKLRDDAKNTRTLKIRASALSKTGRPHPCVMTASVHDQRRLSHGISSVRLYCRSFERSSEGL